MKAEPRRAVPMRLQRDLALKLCADLMRQAGMIPVEVTPRFELDHVPALALRSVDPKTGEFVPHQHDPAHLVWMTKEPTRQRPLVPALRRVEQMSARSHTIAV